MKEIDEILNDLTVYLKEHKPKYLYNQSFVPGKSQVLYSGPYWDEKEIMAAITTFITGKWVVAGENVYKFENAFAKMFGVKHAHMVNSGSSANLVLIAALKKHFNWSDGDEVIVSPVGFPTTISTLVQNGLTPVFIDIEYDTLNFDITKIEEKITSKTKAIFVSPVLGNAPDMDYLTALCEKHNIKLVGDSCDSLGSKWNGKDLSSYYVAWSSSF
jgi:CDP-6-deoxy-D-xylo-4-hexulose-3-dehydrase